jgi:hypothetical protein
LKPTALAVLTLFTLWTVLRVHIIPKSILFF